MTHVRLTVIQFNNLTYFSWESDVSTDSHKNHKKWIKCCINIDNVDSYRQHSRNDLLTLLAELTQNIRVSWSHTSLFLFDHRGTGWGVEIHRLDGLQWINSVLIWQRKPEKCFLRLPVQPAIRITDIRAQDFLCSVTVCSQISNLRRRNGVGHFLLISTNRYLHIKDKTFKWEKLNHH